MIGAAYVMGSMRQAVITGIGHIVSPICEVAFDDLQAAQPPAQAPEITAFEVPEHVPAFGYECFDFELESHLPHIKSFIDPASAFALASARRALADAGLLDTAMRTQGSEIGCAYGTTFGCLEAMRLFWKKVAEGSPKFAPPLPFTQGYANSPSSLLCIEYGLRGASATFSGSFLAGIEALRFALDKIRMRQAEAMLVCASESLSAALHAHLHAERLLSVSGTLGLWYKNNDGIVPGEGGVALVLESAEHASSRGKPAYAMLDEVVLARGEGRNPFVSAMSEALNAISPQPPVDDASLLISGSPQHAVIDIEREVWGERLSPEFRASVLAPKLYTGDLFSASPLFGTALGSRLLLGEKKVEHLPQSALFKEKATRTKYVYAGSLDPLALAGMIALSSDK